MIKLMELRAELKVPKTRYNTFSDFYYRNQEDILDAVKPFLNKYKLYLNISDEMVCLGDRYYCKATVTLTDMETKETVTSIGYAREALDRKKMDDSQLTGSASSYSRKFGLNAMFLLDDVKDADDNTVTADLDMTADKAIKKITNSKTLDELKDVWTEIWKDFEGDIASKQVLKDMKDKKKKELL